MQNEPFFANYLFFKVIFCVSTLLCRPAIFQFVTEKGSFVTAEADSVTQG